METTGQPRFGLRSQTGSASSPTQVATGCGSSGLLQQVMFTYVDAGDEVVFPWPSFEIYPVFCNLFDATQVKIDLVDLGFRSRRGGRCRYRSNEGDLPGDAQQPDGHVRVDNGHRPASSTEIPEDVIVVIDEAYREFSDPAFGDPVTELLPSHPNVLVTRTFSKAYGLAGLRTGYAIGDPELIEQLDKTQLAFSVNNLAQAGALAAIEHEHLAKANVAMLNAERERCVAALVADGWDLGPAHANFVFLPTGERTDDVALDSRNKVLSCDRSAASVSASRSRPQKKTTAGSRRCNTSGLPPDIRGSRLFVRRSAHSLQIT